MRSYRHFDLTIVAFALSVTYMSLCTVPTEAEEVEDRSEILNRTVLAGNQLLDKHLLRPIATAYRDTVPPEISVSVGNFVSNLRAPTVLVNDVLQGNPERAWNTAQRFVLNSTIGVGGSLDPARDLNLPAHRATFGQTLAVWGIGPGPALQLPLVGPTNLRDTAGQVVGSLANSLGFVPGNAMSVISATGKGLGVLHGRAATLQADDALEQTKGDRDGQYRHGYARRDKPFIEGGERGGLASRRGNPSIRLSLNALRFGSERE
ncbi:VacJ family lipoprotein [uncultured Enterovirga sp.]|uniref:MlaA family lipoprotein n=1 Tax=uncultured Enterovirga sp. TaxID=2026352 RepID=UPI0035CA7DE2